MTDTPYATLEEVEAVCSDPHIALWILDSIKYKMKNFRTAKANMYVEKMEDGIHGLIHICWNKDIEHLKHKLPKHTAILLEDGEKKIPLKHSGKQGKSA